MAKWKALVFLLFISTFTWAANPEIEEEEIQAKQLIEDINKEYDSRKNIEVLASWDYASNITDENLEKKNKISATNAVYYKEKTKELLKYRYNDYRDSDLKRQFKKLTQLGYAALPEDKYLALLDAVSSMESNYAKVKICSYENREKCDLQLEPELTNIFSTSRNPDELKYYWEEWYNRAGKPVRKHFAEYIELNNEAARLNNKSSGAEAWLEEYEDETFEKQLENIFEEIRPLFEQLHGYVRNKLRIKYGDNVVSEKGPIPMHLLGNMWAQSWDEIADFISPYPEVKLLDVTDEMVKQKYTPLKMFHMGDEFFVSLNMTKLPPSFWEKSILEKPTDGRDLICHASAWDFFDHDDVRIKQCTRVTMDNFFVVHHELGHIQYFLQYQHLPSVYREGANPGFHEAVGDVLSLSVSTPKHLQTIGLLKDYKESPEATINQLYRAALEKIVFPSFAYTLDKYRWGIFRGEIKPENWNCEFWKMRTQYSGVEPPVERSEDDFDPTAKYHVSADVEYARYLVSYIVQFQFHKAACEKAGEYEPNNPNKALHNCDIFGSPNAGNAIKEMLSLGSSKPWPDAMEVLTGQRKMSASAILEYFKPLQNWLEKENKDSGAYIGWEKSNKCVNGAVVTKN